MVEQRRQAIDLLLREPTPGGDRYDRMEMAVQKLWAGWAALDVSWLGFYLHEGGEELLLGPRMNKPACSPIGLHGVCGRSWRERAVQIIADVHALGADHIVCDPRNLSELVLPLFDGTGVCWGVFDVDSVVLDAFRPADAKALQELFVHWGLTHPL